MLLPGQLQRDQYKFMFLRTGLISLALLFLSRLSGLTRETAMAATLGVGALADAMILMLTLPDLIVGIAVSGAMSYVLLPYWAKLPIVESNQHQSMISCLFAIFGGMFAIAVWTGSSWIAHGLSPTLKLSTPSVTGTAILGAVFALPLAYIGAVFSARLQHREDMLGMHASTLMLNGVLVIGFALLAFPCVVSMPPIQVLSIMAGVLVAGMLARLIWQIHRLGGWKCAFDLKTKIAGFSFLSIVNGIFFSRFSHPTPRLGDWGAGMVVAGVPLIVYLMARSLASREGVGALTTFNYAWRLVELPQLLVVQVLAVLALPALSRAVVHSETVWVNVFRRAFTLAWVLACAAMVALWWGAAFLAQALFGWGRMDATALAQVAEWGTWGALCLLPCAAVSMWLALLASLGRLHRVALAWLAAAGMAAVVGSAWVHTGLAAMVWLNAVWFILAFCVLWQHRVLLLRSMPWSELALPTGVAILAGGLANRLLPLLWWQALLAGAACVVCLLLVAWRTSTSFRQSVHPDAAESLPSAHSD